VLGEDGHQLKSYSVSFRHVRAPDIHLGAALLSRTLSDYTQRMSAKDRYSWALKCPKCGREGEVHVCENDHAYAPPETSVQRVTQGFRIRHAGGTASTTVLECSTCGEVAG
jgi:hypothetical protein